ncbi:sensor histidine kinase [Roseospira marina]|nr:PAS domain-containing sensor histidine kinase [Roseospira marina]MBB4314466.1 PAS domain S-box-containing protein [Roseospira marina]MBB5087626.1 PAS domain S-box-containing protein [Roseospira marina]
MTNARILEMLSTHGRLAETRPALRELLIFLVFGGLGTAAAYVTVNVPDTEIFLSGRYAFGLMGMVLVRRWWTAFLLTALLAAVGEHALPLALAWTLNMLINGPLMVLLRVVYRHLLERLENTLIFGVLWIATVMLYYQIVMVAIGVVESVRSGVPLEESVQTFLLAQTLLVESALVAAISAAGLTMLRSYELVVRERRELEVTLRSIGDAVIVTDADGVVRRVNTEAARLTGWTPEEARGRPLAEVLRLVHSLTRAPVHAPLPQALAEGTTVGLDRHTTLIARDGREFHIADSAAPIRDMGADGAFGPARGVVIVFRDVSEAYRIQADLEEQKRNFDMAVKASAIGVWDWDIRANRIIRSGDYAQMFGLAEGITEGGPLTGDITDRILPEDLEPIASKIQSVLDTGDEYAHTFRVRGPDGTVRWLRSLGRVTARDSQGPTHISGTTQDITDLQTMVMALRRSNADLERFAYVASHDLQEPIRNLVAYSQLLGRRYGDHLDSDAREFLGFIIASAKRMRSLVLDLLEYSRVSSRAHPFTAVDLNAVVAGALGNLDQAIKDAGARITVGACPVVVGDEPQITSLIQNMVANAIKFRRPGVVPTVDITVRSGPEAWELSVADNGIGFDPQFKDHIFEAFKRLHALDAFPGTGIGLAVTKRIVERHGGSITADGTPGVGSRFTVRIPNTPPGVPDPTPAMASGVVPGTSTGPSPEMAGAQRAAPGAAPESSFGD